MTKKQKKKDILSTEITNKTASSASYATPFDSPEDSTPKSPLLSPQSSQDHQTVLTQLVSELRTFLNEIKPSLASSNTSTSQNSQNSKIDLEAKKVHKSCQVSLRGSEEDNIFEISTVKGLNTLPLSLTKDSILEDLNLPKTEIKTKQLKRTRRNRVGAPGRSRATMICSVWSIRGELWIF